jgi:uncharacterized membrane protein (DUF106 family)
VEKQKESAPELGDKNHKKKLDRLEENLKNNNRELSMVKMKSMMIISFAFMALLSIFNSMYININFMLNFYQFSLKTIISL